MGELADLLGDDGALVEAAVSEYVNAQAESAEIPAEAYEAAAQGLVEHLLTSEEGAEWRAELEQQYANQIDLDAQQQAIGLTALSERITQQAQKTGVTLGDQLNATSEAQALYGRAIATGHSNEEAQKYAIEEATRASSGAQTYKSIAERYSRLDLAPLTGETHPTQRIDPMFLPSRKAD